MDRNRDKSKGKSSCVSAKNQPIMIVDEESNNSSNVSPSAIGYDDYSDDQSCIKIIDNVTGDVSIISTNEAAAAVPRKLEKPLSVTRASVETRRGHVAPPHIYRNMASLRQSLAPRRFTYHKRFRAAKSLLEVYPCNRCRVDFNDRIERDVHQSVCLFDRVLRSRRYVSPPHPTNDLETFLSVLKLLQCSVSNISSDEAQRCKSSSACPIDGKPLAGDGGEARLKSDRRVGSDSGASVEMGRVQAQPCQVSVSTDSRISEKSALDTETNLSSRLSISSAGDVTAACASQPIESSFSRHNSQEDIAASVEWEAKQMTNKEPDQEASSDSTSSDRIINSISNRAVEDASSISYTANINNLTNLKEKEPCNSEADKITITESGGAEKLPEHSRFQSPPRRRLLSRCDVMFHDQTLKEEDGEPRVKKEGSPLHPRLLTPTSKSLLAIDLSSALGVRVRKYVIAQMAAQSKSESIQRTSKLKPDKITSVASVKNAVAVKEEESGTEKLAANDSSPVKSLFPQNHIVEVKVETMDDAFEVVDAERSYAEVKIENDESNGCELNTANNILLENTVGSKSGKRAESVVGRIVTGESSVDTTDLTDNQCGETCSNTGSKSHDGTSKSGDSTPEVKLFEDIEGYSEPRSCEVYLNPGSQESSCEVYNVDTAESLASSTDYRMDSMESCGELSSSDVQFVTISGFARPNDGWDLEVGSTGETEDSCCSQEAELLRGVSDPVQLGDLQLENSSDLPFSSNDDIKMDVPKELARVRATCESETILECTRDEVKSKDDSDGYKALTDSHDVRSSTVETSTVKSLSNPVAVNTTEGIHCDMAKTEAICVASDSANNDMSRSTATCVPGEGRTESVNSEKLSATIQSTQNCSLDTSIVTGGRVDCAESSFTYSCNKEEESGEIDRNISPLWSPALFEQYCSTPSVLLSIEHSSQQCEESFPVIYRRRYHRSSALNQLGNNPSSGNSVSYCHTYKFTRNERLRYYRAVERGLDWESYQLKKSLSPCAVSLRVLTEDEVSDWKRSKKLRLEEQRLHISHPGKAALLPLKPSFDGLRVRGSDGPRGRGLRRNFVNSNYVTRRTVGDSVAAELNFTNGGYSKRGRKISAVNWSKEFVPSTRTRRPNCDRRGGGARWQQERVADLKQDRKRRTDEVIAISSSDEEMKGDCDEDIVCTSVAKGKPVPQGNGSNSTSGNGSALLFRCHVCNAEITCSVSKPETIQQHYVTQHNINNIEIVKQLGRNGEVVLSIVQSSKSAQLPASSSSLSSTSSMKDSSGVVQSEGSNAVAKSAKSRPTTSTRSESANSKVAVSNCSSTLSMARQSLTNKLAAYKPPANQTPGMVDTNRTTCLSTLAAAFLNTQRGSKPPANKITQRSRPNILSRRSTSTTAVTQPSIPQPVAFTALAMLPTTTVGVQAASNVHVSGSAPSGDFYPGDDGSAVDLEIICLD